MDSFYTVIRGDTLFGIAQRFYGDGNKFPIIARANGIADPGRIFPGQVLRIPDLTPPDPGPGPDPQEPPDPVEFRLLRPADLLNVQCVAIGCRVVADGAAPTEPLARHTVVHGDNLWNLAVHYYGDGRLYRLIAEANHIPNPSLLRPGQVLIIPRRPGPPPPPPPVTHVVVAGDTLWDLAQRFYENPFRYREIAAANHIANPSLIFPGQVLVIPGIGGPPPPPTVTRLVAVTDNAHLIVTFGPQNIYEEATLDDPLHQPPNTPDVARARAATDSRVVFELHKKTEIPFTVSGVLKALSTLGLRVPPLAVPRLEANQQRPPEALVPPAAPKDDQTAIEAPYRLIVSPDVNGGFTHAADAATAPSDSNRVELWHSRLGVRRIVDGKFVGVDENDDKLRTVRAVWTRDDDDTQAADPDYGSLTPADRRAIVRQTANPKPNDGQTVIEPEPLTVEKLFLSALGAWVDWRVAWPRSAEYTGFHLSAYRHLAPMGRDSYVRVETPIYLFPFGHRGTLVKLTERRIKAADGDQVAHLFKRYFIVLREHTRSYENERLNRLPFKRVSIDPLVSPDINQPPDPATTSFVPEVGADQYLWKITAVDWADRVITMATALVAVPEGAPGGALTTWNDEIAKHKSIDVGGVEVAFAKAKTPGDTTARLQFLDLTGDPFPLTSTPWMVKAHITIPALATVNRGGGPVAVKYEDAYTAAGFENDDPAQIFLVLDQENKLNFSGGSDRGGGFVEPNVAINAISRTQGAVGDKGAPNGIKDNKFNPGAFLGQALPKLFGLFDLKDILLEGRPLSEAPKLIADQLDFIGSVGADYANLVAGLQKARATLDVDIAAATTAGAEQRLQALRNQTQLAIDKLAAKPVQPLVDSLIKIAKGEANSAGNLPSELQQALGEVKALTANQFLPAYLRALIERPYKALDSALTLAQGNKLIEALKNPLEGSTVRYEWTPTIKGWGPAPGDDNRVFIPARPDQALTIAVEVRVPKEGDPQSDVSAQLRNFRLQLLPGAPLMSMTFSRIGFRVATGGKPEVDVQFDKLEFLGALGFIEKLRRLIPFDGFADPPYVDISPAGATAGFELALPSVAVGVFTLENIALSADCRVPFLGEAVTVGFGFCSKESPFRLTVMAIGGGGWVAIRLAPKGLVMLEMGLEAGASLSVDLGVASGSVSVMIGVFLRLEGEKGQLTGYFRIRGEVEVLGIASASITLELSLTYDFASGKLVGRASLRVEIEIAFFSASVEITCERKLAGSKGDPTLTMIMPPTEGGLAMWDQYFSSFAIGA
ncbi:LysM peptidoglycan-binding domain-containing protein [Nocardia sp. bgisy118]|uniref:LysM peptidoglycan-binding domain-containing protein n=1 Tax=Nocardia sp. bgisy118 TaxID=3413786 RepID=UPI003F4A422F